MKSIPSDSKARLMIVLVFYNVFAAIVTALYKPPFQSDALIDHLFRPLPAAKLPFSIALLVVSAVFSAAMLRSVWNGIAARHSPLGTLTFQEALCISLFLAPIAFG